MQRSDTSDLTVAIFRSINDCMSNIGPHPFAVWMEKHGWDRQSVADWVVRHGRTCSRKWIGYIITDARSCGYHLAELLEILTKGEVTVAQFKQRGPARRAVSSRRRAA